MDRKEILRIIETKKPDIKKLGVKKLVLIGSFANDCQTEQSDVDFIVQFKKGRGLFKDYSNLYNLLEASLKRNIDLIKDPLLRDEIRESIMGGKVYEAKV
jgi:uncharacterized protein